MKTLIKQFDFPPHPLSIANKLQGEPGFVLLLSGLKSHQYSRYTFLCRKPFLEFSSRGSISEITAQNKKIIAYGNLWKVLENLIQRYELLNEIDLPFPLGGAFGYWGYELKNHLEQKIATRATYDYDLPECKIYFYDSLLAYDHQINKLWIISTGMEPNGSRSEMTAKRKLNEWLKIIEDTQSDFDDKEEIPSIDTTDSLTNICSNMSKDDFISAVKKAKQYIYSGHIYQVNLSHRIEATFREIHPFNQFINLLRYSPAPFAAFMNFGDFQFISSSPELFLKMTDRHILTRPIKGTRPRRDDPQTDLQMEYELKTSQKEIAELVMITDLLRNDLGKVCQYGSVFVSELLKSEKHPNIYHLVSTIEGELNPGVSHLNALSACFPGGSITGAPKIRAMEIIDELEPTARGIYTGAHGYIGFNTESQLAITIRTAICKENKIWFQTGAGIVADSIPEAEYQETIDKAKGFLLSINVKSKTDTIPAYGRIF